jgi:hypothetical protein
VVLIASEHVLKISLGRVLIFNLGDPNWQRADPLVGRKRPSRTDSTQFEAKAHFAAGGFTASALAAAEGSIEFT